CEVRLFIFRSFCSLVTGAEAMKDLFSISVTIAALEWTRTDLGTYVFLYRDGHFDTSYQNPSFENRVELEDRHMRNGDLSVILRNVTRSDSGTYECRFSGAAYRRRRANTVAMMFRVVAGWLLLCCEWLQGGCYCFLSGCWVVAMALLDGCYDVPLVAGWLLCHCCYGVSGGCYGCLGGFQISTGTKPDALLPQPEPRTRDDFLQYSRQITLDPNTAHRELLLSDWNRKATRVKAQQSYSRHPQRFTEHCQVLSTESLTGRCYWEVEWRGWRVSVAAAYQDVSRTGDDGIFGNNDKSWALECDRNSLEFIHNRKETPIRGRVSFRIGVYLDHGAGVLSFYSVSETMTLLHSVQTTFTQPLHAGIYFHYHGAIAEFCELK
uniref:B30.2/SPRY domain-containing protein n=1 Tax=Myripristis murdjan TaxID=586833 RepID=A0A667ZMP3_9TELE